MEGTSAQLCCRTGAQQVSSRRQSAPLRTEVVAMAAQGCALLVAVDKVGHLRSVSSPLSVAASRGEGRMLPGRGEGWGVTVQHTDAVGWTSWMSRRRLGELLQQGGKETAPSTSPGERWPARAHRPDSLRLARTAGGAGSVPGSELQCIPRRTVPRPAPPKRRAAAESSAVLRGAFAAAVGRQEPWRGKREGQLERRL